MLRTGQRQGKPYRLQRPPPRNHPHRRPRPRPSATGHFECHRDDALKHVLAKRPQQTGPQLGKPLPGTARFRKPASASQSLPDPATVRRQPRQTPSPIQPGQAGDKPERLRSTPSRAHPDPTTRV